MSRNTIFGTAVSAGLALSLGLALSMAFTGHAASAASAAQVVHLANAADAQPATPMSVTPVTVANAADVTEASSPFEISSIGLTLDDALFFIRSEFANGNVTFRDPSAAYAGSVDQISVFFDDGRISKLAVWDMFGANPRVTDRVNLGVSAEAAAALRLGMSPAAVKNIIGFEPVLEYDWLTFSDGSSEISVLPNYRDQVIAIQTSGLDLLEQPDTRSGVGISAGAASDFRIGMTLDQVLRIIGEPRAIASGTQSLTLRTNHDPSDENNISVHFIEATGRTWEVANTKAAAEIFETSVFPTSGIVPELPSLLGTWEFTHWQVPGIIVPSSIMVWNESVTISDPSVTLNPDGTFVARQSNASWGAIRMGGIIPGTIKEVFNYWEGVWTMNDGEVTLTTVHPFGVLGENNLPSRSRQTPDSEGPCWWTGIVRNGIRFQEVLPRDMCDNLEPDSRISVAMPATTVDDNFFGEIASDGQRIGWDRIQP